MMSAKLSFIEDTEVETANKFIEEHLGFEPPRTTGWHMAVKLYVREKDVHQIKDDEGNPILGSNGKPIYIELPESVRAHDKYRSCTALVVSQGPDCYKDERYKEAGPWCKVGDWVVIPRNEGTQINYRGIPMQIIPEDRVLAIIEDPTYVTRD